MKKTILRNALYSTLLVTALSFTSCGKKETATDTETNTTTESVETEQDGDLDKGVRDTVVEDNDTVVKMGRQENPAPAQEQVP
ncbi:hypothetical protein HYN59_10120 [Flavobacterium album]|uniref:Uncharacterized protein n=1 Tax=Flavobacterium album TaxID=2175091 RepID=A0A2S1QYM9_9FLAO|nr:hypothetical protein [Flavobacterium album]AWH85449.1 hypothetical protein HYN59_10120 [Flavobacterium album]